MFYAGRNIVDISLTKLFFYTINGQLNYTRQNKANLRGMGMFRQLDIFLKLHKNHLMISGLRQISLEAINWYVCLR